MKSCLLLHKRWCVSEWADSRIRYLLSAQAFEASTVQHAGRRFVIVLTPRRSVTLGATQCSLRNAVGHYDAPTHQQIVRYPQGDHSARFVAST
jgi:hypothetical protein